MKRLVAAAAVILVAAFLGAARADGRPTVVRERRLGDGMVLQLRRVETSDGADYTAWVRRHGRWYACGTLPIDEEECGAGTCTTQAIGWIRVRRTADILWITLRERTKRADTDPEDGRAPDASYADLVLAFGLGAHPTCTGMFPRAVFPDGSIYDNYSAHVVGHSVVLRWVPDTGGKTRRVVVHVVRSAAS